MKCLAVDGTNIGAGLTVNAVNIGARREMNMLRPVRATQCNHINRYLGHNARERPHTLVASSKDGPEDYNQKTVNLHQSYGDHGNLRKT